MYKWMIEMVEAPRIVYWLLSILAVIAVLQRFED